MRLTAFFDTHMEKYNVNWFVTSHFCSSKQLFYFRAFFAMWSFLVLIYSMVVNITIQSMPAWVYWSFFTHLSWLGLIVYFLVSGEGWK